MVKYLRFLGVYLFAVATMAGLLLGGAWMWLGFAVIYGGMILGDGSSATPRRAAYGHPRLLNSLLYLALPALFVLCVAMAWMAGSGDLLGLGAVGAGQLGLDLFARREATSAWHWIGGILSSGITFAALGTNVGHELTHRTSDRGAMIAGRWLLAVTFDAEFSIEHVYGHHRRLATPADPASARRGEHFYRFLRALGARPDAQRRSRSERSGCRRWATASGACTTVTCAAG